MLISAGLTAGAQVSVPTYHNDNLRSGLNTNEAILSPTNVNSTAFGKLFTYAVDGYVYTQPLYVPNLNIQGQGTHNVFFIATEHNTVYAFDADSAGTGGGLLWKTNLGASAVTTIPGVYTNKNFGTRYNNGSYLDVQPEVGVTGTPVIDLNNGTLYVDAFTGEISGGVTNYFHRLHALNITNGTEQPYSPVAVTASVPGIGLDSVGGTVSFNAKQEIQRCALTLAGGVVYLCYAGYADTNPYHGWVIGFNATNLVQLTNYIFNVTPNSLTADFDDNAGEGGVWASGGGLSVDNQTNLYFETGNGAFNVTDGSGNTEYGDSFIKLSTTNGLAVADYFTPYNQNTLQALDQDLGSGGLLLLPDQPGGVTNELVGAGKQGVIYLLNRDKFTTSKHYGGSDSTDYVRQSLSGKIKGSFDTPVCFNNRLYYAGNGDYLKSFPLTGGLIGAGSVVSNLARTFSFPGATPSLSAKGTNNGIIWALQMGVSQVLVACNASNLAEIYTSAQAAANRDKLANGTKFAVPTVADGPVFVGSSNVVSVFGLLGGTFSFSSPTYRVAEANTNVIITVNRIGGTNGTAQVNYNIAAGGTAVNGVNYTNTSGTLSWAAGESGAKNFAVQIFNDNLAEANPTINLSLNTLAGPPATGLQTTAVLTIVKAPIKAWKFAQFGTNANNTAIAGDTVDPDHDGVVNLLEYAYGTNPNGTNSNPFTGTLAGNQFQLHFTRNIAASDLTYNIQTSTTLTNWSNLLTYTASTWITNITGAAVTESSTNGVPPNQSVNVTATIPTAGKTNQFFRLGVNR